MPVFVKRPKSLLTDDTNKFRRNICSTQHSLGRRLDPLDGKQEIHPLRHPAVLLSLLVVLQPLLLGKVHIAAVATVISVRSKNGCFLFAQAAFKKGGRGGSGGLSNQIVTQFQVAYSFDLNDNLTWQMPQTTSRCWLSFSFSLVRAFWCPSSMLQVGSMIFENERKMGNKPLSTNISVKLDYLIS